MVEKNSNLKQKEVGNLIKTQNVNAKLLDDYIEKSGLRISYLTEQLGISRQAFDMKRKSINAFRASEVFVLCNLLHITEEDKKQIFLF
jgi:hypothetical protein